ncbi:MAG TPA: 30S ribosomal protein S17 [Candidatus Dormibacteraeota bacterium]|nr:30S ribosomal protein S17 [Candidatus Dormibacteraeota bacterium]
MAQPIIGIVSSNKTDKTIVVTVQTRKTHPLYRKQYTESKKFMAHDPNNEAQVGDKVSIVETRPISARKHHKLSQIIEKPLLREDALSITKDDTEEMARQLRKAKVQEEET